MNQFRMNSINVGEDRLNEILKIARKKKELKLKGVAQRLNINIKYLKALEEGRFDSLPSGLYGKNFLKEYSLYLGLDPNEILELYDKRIIKQKSNSTQDPFSKKVLGAQHFLTIPKLIKNILISLVLIVCVAYLGYYLNNIISQPKLVVENPKDNFVTQERHVSVRGYTENETEIIINDEEVLIDDEGRFSKDLSLKTGLNTIIIEAKKKHSRTNTIIRKVLVENDRE